MIRVEDQIEEHLDLCSTYRQQHDSVWATFVFQISPGVVSARASLLTNSVAVEYQPEKTDFASMRKSIEQAGYKVAEDQTVAEIAASDEGLAPEEIAQQQEYRTLMRKFWFAAIVSVPVMALSYPDLIPGCASGCRWAVTHVVLRANSIVLTQRDLRRFWKERRLASWGKRGGGVRTEGCR